MLGRGGDGPAPLDLTFVWDPMYMWDPIHACRKAMQCNANKHDTTRVRTAPTCGVQPACYGWRGPWAFVDVPAAAEARGRAGSYVNHSEAQVPTLRIKL